MTPIKTATSRRIYYGWWIVVVGVVGAFLGATTSQLFTGAMLPSIEEGTGWSRSTITLAVTLGSIASGLSAPFWGRMVDRHGPRIVTAFGAAAVGLGLLLIGLSSVVHIVLFYFGYLVARSVSQNAVSGVVTRASLVNWFKRMRGRALGLVSMSVVLGGALLVPIARMISSHWGWEIAYALFGILMIAVMVPLALLVLRRSPEEMGLLPDGEDSRTVISSSIAQLDDHDFTVAEAVRTSAFWLLLFSQAIASFSTAGITFHQASYYQEHGLEPGTAALAISAFALAGAFANGLWGFLVERISERILGSVTLFLAGLLPFYLLTVNSVFGVFTFAVLFGLTARGEGAIIAVIIAQYFGRGSFGAISGASGPSTQIALGLGPAVAAFVYELAGKSYDTAFILNGMLFMIAAALIFLSRKPQDPYGTQDRVQSSSRNA